MSTSPTQRTIKYLKDKGNICGIVERFNSSVGQHGIRQDLFGFIDIISIDPDIGIVGVQSCGQAFSEHIRKILSLEDDKYVALISWLKHAELHLYGWRKVKRKRGGKQMIWQPRFGKFFIEDGEVKFKEER